MIRSQLSRILKFFVQELRVEKPEDLNVIILFPDSGGFAAMEIFPALYALSEMNLLPKKLRIVGCSPSPLTDEDFKKIVTKTLKVKRQDRLEPFLGMLKGAQDKSDSLAELHRVVEGLKPSHRIFYVARPTPSILSLIKETLYAASGENKIVLENPFGTDLASAREMAVALSSHWDEHEIFRVDQSLSQEMVKNLMILRFGNTMFGAVWNRDYIDSIQIRVKESIWTSKPGADIEDCGIVRNVMRSMLQILGFICMEKPVALDAEDVRNEKVKLLRSIKALTKEDLLLGQYGKSIDGEHSGYADQANAADRSGTPTYAMAKLAIKNERWDGVPITLLAGKGLDEDKTDIRIRFKSVFGNIYAAQTTNELKITVLPKETVEMAIINKKPGLTSEIETVALDLSYANRYDEDIPSAYQSLIHDVLRGDRSNFLRNDELDAEWRVFDHVLNEMGTGNKLETYPCGTSGPAGVDEFLRKKPSGMAR